METSNESVTATAQSEQTQDQTKLEVKFSAEELTERLVAVSSEARKYRQEKAALKQDLETLQAQLGELKKSSLESQGNYKGLYEETRAKLEEAEGKFKSQVGKYALNVIQTTVKEGLLSAKCQRPDAILKLSADKIRSFELDEDFKPSPAEVKALVEEAQKDYPEWFKQETPKLNDGFPIGKVPEKSVSSLSNAEIMARLKAMDSKRS
jgi:hypothetical protein